MTKRIPKLLMASIILIVVGGILAIVFKPDTKISKVELNHQELTYSLVETVVPNPMNQVAVKLNLKGDRYYEKSSNNSSGRRRRTNNRSSTRQLAYEIPIAVKMTRVRDGKVLVDHNHVFGLEPDKKARVIQKHGESGKSRISVGVYPELRIMVGNYPEIPRLESPEELRIDLTLEKDTTYGAWLEGGTLEINQKGGTTGQTIGLSMVVLGALGGLLLGFLLFIRLLFSMFSKRR